MLLLKTKLLKNNHRITIKIIITLRQMKKVVYPTRVPWYCLTHYHYKRALEGNIYEKHIQGVPDHQYCMYRDKQINVNTWI